MSKDSVFIKINPTSKIHIAKVDEFFKDKPYILRCKHRGSGFANIFDPSKVEVISEITTKNVKDLCKVCITILRSNHARNNSRLERV